MPSEPTRSTNTQSHSKLRSLRHHPMLRWIDAKFVHRPRIYLVQSILAGVVLVGILITEDALTNVAVVAAVASSVPINSVIFILSAAVIISVVRFALYRHLHNLI